MKPFIREVGRARLAPVGWMAQPAGEWAGREIEIVFDPERHQVVKFTEPPSVLTKVAMAAEGFRPLASAGRQEMWVAKRPRGRVTRDGSRSTSMPSSPSTKTFPARNVTR